MLTIAYITFRRRPRFEWFAASLRREMNLAKCEDIQIIVIDGRLWHDSDRAESMRRAARGKITFEHYPPKPSVWQGPNRLTSKDYFAAASVRNTAFCYATREHVAFVDDLSVLRPGWLISHLAAARGKFTLCGTTCKNKNIVVSDDGLIVSYDLFPPGQDSRIGLLRSDVQPCGGNWLYGGTFSVPLERALQVNGQDEIHDIIGGEDYDFGVRLGRTGCQTYVSRLCQTFEDEDGHHSEAPMVRLDKPWPPNGSSPGWDGPYVSNLLLNRLMRETDRYQTLGVQPNLRALRASVLRGEPFPVPTEPSRYFSDNQPLRDM